MTSEMTLGVMLAITVGAAIYVAWPLLAGRTPSEEYLGGEAGESTLQRLMFQRDTTYAAMKELEFDFAMGNLSQQDYQQLQERYKRKAVAILRRIDDVKTGKRVPVDFLDADGDDYDQMPVATRREPDRAKSVASLDVEQEIEAFRRRAKAQVAGNGATPVAADSRVPSKCPSCGRPITDPEAVFCSKCGATLRRRGKKYTQDKGDHHG